MLDVLATLLLMGGIIVMVMSLLASLLFGFPAGLFALGLVAVVMSIVLRVLHTRQRAAAAEAGEHMRCPECRELVRRDARKCKHCQAALTPQTVKDGTPL